MFDERVPPIDNVTRVLAVPVAASGRHYVVLVGASLQDRRDQVLQLGATLAVAGAALLVLAGLGAWWLVGAALRPVERLRRQAATISAALGTRTTSLPSRAAATPSSSSALGAPLVAIVAPLPSHIHGLERTEAPLPDRRWRESRRTAGRPGPPPARP